MGVSKMDKLQILPPTLRDTYRYVVFEIISKRDVSFGEVVDVVWKAALGLYGDAGTSEMGLWVPETLYDASKKRGVIRASHTAVETLRAALASIREINGVPVIFVVTGVTGTIRSAKNKFLGIVDLKDFAEEKG